MDEGVCRCFIFVYVCIFFFFFSRPHIDEFDDSFVFGFFYRRMDGRGFIGHCFVLCLCY